MQPARCYGQISATYDTTALEGNEENRFLPTFSPRHASSASYDLIIRNGQIIDGTGSPWYSSDIGIRNGRIAAIGFLGSAQAKRTIADDGAALLT